MNMVHILHVLKNKTTCPILGTKALNLVSVFLTTTANNYFLKIFKKLNVIKI